MTVKFTNRLAKETSPYLLQHAHNPVDWYPWGEEALERAKKENKPVLVSIGYSSCHWCHVMERESFENESIAQLMNENFVNIKIDREERPDLDHIYMDAVQAMVGNGGWPLNVFLTPEGKPFYGGTYFPPSPAFNRASWPDVLMGVSKAFNERRDEIDTQAENLTVHLVQSNTFGMNGPKSEGLFTIEKIQEAATNILKQGDKVWGGFGRAPKFPQTFSIVYLLRYAQVMGDETAEEAKQQALLSLDKMIAGGIYDQVGGGFARYSTDTEWLAPHFEKMLYDNALLLSALSEAYQLTGNKKYADIIDETIGFLKREMMHEKGGFYSALDADSEGVEGKFYVWELDEVNELLGKDAAIFTEFFDITAKGNFEHKNILRRKKEEDEFAKEKNISHDQLLTIINNGKKKLLEQRNKRIRPQLDDKVLLGWNALLNTALSKAFAATGNEEYKTLAIKNMDFLLGNFQETKNEKRVASGETLFHTWKNNVAKHPAFLDDYAYLIQALIHLQEITGEHQYLIKAKNFTQYVSDHFSEDQTGFFFYTSNDQTDVIVRKKEVYDGAQPSGNAVMMDNLYRLSLFFDLPDWKTRAVDATRSIGEAIIKYPTSFGVWGALVLELTTGTNELVISGRRGYDLLKEVLRFYIPHKIVMYSEKESSDFPLLKDKKVGENALIYLCRNYTCERPISEPVELLEMIRAKELKIS